MERCEYYGELMNQWDSAAPPGGRFSRRVFDKSLMGMEMCAGGPNIAEKSAQKSYEWNKKLHDHTKDVGERKVAFTEESIVIQKRNQKKQIDFQDAERLNTWSHNEQIRKLDNQYRFDAWHNSENIFSQQLNLNQQAKTGASDAAKIRKLEREVELELDTRKTHLDASGSRLNLETFKKEAAFENQSNYLEGLKAIGTASYNKGRSAVKGKISALAGVALKSARIAQEVNNTASKTNLELLGYNLESLGHGETKLSIDRKYNSEMTQIQHHLLQSDLNAEARRLAPPLQYPPIQSPNLLPRVEFQNPDPYVAGPAPIKYAGYSAAGGGGGGGAVSSALGAVGSTMTALAGMNAGFMTFGPALGPIGIGLSGLGMIGSAFNWW